MDKLFYLKRSKIFSSMDPGSLKKLNHSAQMQRFARGEMIYRESDPAQTLFLLKEGRVRVSKISQEGRTFTLAVLGPGDVFGETALHGGNAGDRRAYAEVLENCLVCVLRREDMERLMREVPDLAIKMLSFVGERLKEMEERIEDIVFHDVPSRLARLILALADEWGRPSPEGLRIPFRTTHQELADMVGCARETASLALGDFREDGLIDLRDREIVVKNDKGLREWVQ